MIYKIYTIEEEIADDGSVVKHIKHDGICTRSPDGTLWKLTVTDAGAVVAVTV